jgi:hypothetical protein
VITCASHTPLRRLPLVTAAFADGRVSYSKVRALVRMAHTTDEEVLLALATSGTAADLEVRAREVRAGADPRSPYAGRSLLWRRASDGSLLVHARIPAVRGAAFLARIDEVLVTVGADGNGQERQSKSGHHRLAAQRLDALLALVGLPAEADRPGEVLDGDTLAPSAPATPDRAEPPSADRGDEYRNVADDVVARLPHRIGSADQARPSGPRSARRRRRRPATLHRSQPGRRRRSPSTRHSGYRRHPGGRRRRHGPDS